ncbi:MAG: hypothetical protein IPH41_13270 [Sulfuritalea sp.]|nr:hypothetical protein [Sulfuritalea sp.]
MDNAALFGEVLYALPFGKAIERKLLTDYRVVIIGVDDPTIAQWIARRELVSTGTGVETDSESLAAQIGLLKAIKDYDLRRVISFHSPSIARAFASTFGRCGLDGDNIVREPATLSRRRRQQTQREARTQGPEHRRTR